MHLKTNATQAANRVSVGQMAQVMTAGSPPAIQRDGPHAGSTRPETRVIPIDRNHVQIVVAGVRFGILESSGPSLAFASRSKWKY